MSDSDPISEQPADAREPTEAELRAALEEELKRVRVSDVLIQTLVTLINLGGRRLGLAPGAEDQVDLAQAREAIDGVRALLPIVERSEGESLAPVKDALAQLQMAYAQASGDSPPAEPGPGEPGQEGPEGGPGPAESSGRLWVPGS